MVGGEQKDVHLLLNDRTCDNGSIINEMGSRGGTVNLCHQLVHVVQCGIVETTMPPERKLFMDELFIQYLKKNH